MERIDPNAHPLLLVDDEPQILSSCRLTLLSAGLGPVETLSDSRDVLPFLGKRKVAGVVLDLGMPHLCGRELLSRIREAHPETPVVILTGRDELATAVECMKAGAFDYLVKPVEPSRFVSAVRRIHEMRDLREELERVKEQLLAGKEETDPAFDAVLTVNGRMLAAFRYVAAIAPSGKPVLVTGETGVGKELIAQAVHALSRRKGVFVAVNVSGLDDQMFSDTLFGHRKGAFTGAEEHREGLVARAAAGTLFLDEIGDLKESSQVKLLRLLEERQYYPLGVDVPRSTDSRVVCATHQHPGELLATGRMRKDLYYRLAGHHVHIPPLRERLEDLPVLVDHFLAEAARELGKRKPTPPPELLTLLSNYDFPGNVRELKMMVSDAVARHPGGVLSMESFRRIAGAGTKSAPAPAEGEGGAGPAPGEAPVAIRGRFPTLKEADEFLIVEALRRARGNQGIAASMLGITRQALNKRLSRGGKGNKPGEG